MFKKLFFVLLTLQMFSFANAKELNFSIQYFNSERINPETGEKFNTSDIELINDKIEEPEAVVLTEFNIPDVIRITSKARASIDPRHVPLLIDFKSNQSATDLKFVLDNNEVHFLIDVSRRAYHDTQDYYFYLPDDGVYVFIKSINDWVPLMTDSLFSPQSFSKEFADTYLN